MKAVQGFAVFAEDRLVTLLSSAAAGSMPLLVCVCVGGGVLPFGLTLIVKDGFVPLTKHFPSVIIPVVYMGK